MPEISLVNTIEINDFDLKEMIDKTVIISNIDTKNPDSPRAHIAGCCFETIIKKTNKILPE